MCEHNVIALKATKHSFEAVKNERVYFGVHVGTYNRNTYKRNTYKRNTYKRNTYKHIYVPMIKQIIKSLFWSIKTNCIYNVHKIPQMCFNVFFPPSKTYPHSYWSIQKSSELMISQDMACCTYCGGFMLNQEKSS